LKQAACLRLFVCGAASHHYKQTIKYTQTEFFDMPSQAGLAKAIIASATLFSSLRKTFREHFRIFQPGAFLGRGRDRRQQASKAAKSLRVS
jgi:hypothetical protein